MSYVHTSAKVLQNVKCATPLFPTLGEILDDTTYKIDQLLDKGKKSKKNQDKKEAAFLHWNEQDLERSPIHSRQKELKRGMD